ncbi:DUF2498 family protein [Xenorhabdus miraniensis]
MALTQNGGQALNMFKHLAHILSEKYSLVD